MPLNFFLNIYNAKTSLKEAEFEQREIEKLEFNYKPKDKKEKEEVNGVLMHAKDPLECRNKIIDAFKDGTFRSEHLKGLDDSAYDYVLKDVNKFTEEIRPMEEKINLSLFEEFFEYSSPVDFAKILINIKNRDKNKKNVEDIENRILALKDRIENMSKKEQKMRVRH